MTNVILGLIFITLISIDALAQSKTVQDTTITCETEDVEQYYRVGILGDEFSPEDIEVFVVKNDDANNSATLIYNELVNTHVSNKVTSFEAKSKRFKVSIYDGSNWETRGVLLITEEGKKRKLSLVCELDSSIEYDVP